MKKIILLLGIFSLSGCANQRLQNHVQNELETIRMTQAIIKHVCFKDGEEGFISEKNMISAIECEWQIIKQQIVPISVAPDIWLQAEGNALLDANDLQTGKINKTEFKAREKILFSGIMTRLGERTNQIHQVNEARKEKALSDLQNWSYRQQMIDAANRPVRTHCNDMGGGSISCTSQ